jgi:P27 family predicted phage terminase small subunit
MRGAKPKLVVDNGAVKKNAPAPTWMSAEAKREWRRVMPLLVERRILTTADLGSLENYCIHVGTIRQMDRHIEEHGAIFEQFKENEDGDMISLGMKRNPAVGIRSDSTTQARLLSAELGLTPTSRSRPSIREDGHEDELVDF